MMASPFRFGFIVSEFMLKCSLQWQGVGANVFITMNLCFFAVDSLVILISFYCVKSMLGIRRPHVVWKAVCLKWKMLCRVPAMASASLPPTATDCHTASSASSASRGEVVFSPPPLPTSIQTIVAHVFSPLAIGEYYPQFRMSLLHFSSRITSAFTARLALFY